ncbi:hypothetical protein [Cellulomonas chitinilytica]|uniref:hypothetical protein n=1 Tax=Cellulomonas chitinilytica TaxID=398759 RepID=UPI001944FC01|nr:hypothetical protein [Cellulomonas chitinilytica]
MLAELAQIADVLDEVEAALVAVLARFAGYGDRFRAALDAGRITDPRDSCHQVWFELHEDLIATLGITRH